MGGNSTKPVLKISDHISLESYSGLWYVISRIGTPFEKGHCNSIERYIMRPDGKLNVLYTANKKRVDGKEFKAKALLWSGKRKDGRLKVGMGWPLAFDYLIIDIDPDYKWAMVGVPNRKYLWIMSRDTTIDQSLHSKLVDQAKAKGFSVDKLEIVEHSDRKNAV